MMPSGVLSLDEREELHSLRASTARSQDNGRWILLALVGGLPALLVAAAACLAALHTNARLTPIADQVNKVEIATNSIKDALVKATHDSALAEGKAQGRAELKAENAIGAAAARETQGGGSEVRGRGR